MGKIFCLATNLTGRKAKIGLIKDIEIMG